MRPIVIVPGPGVGERITCQNAYKIASSYTLQRPEDDRQKSPTHSGTHDAYCARNQGTRYLLNKPVSQTLASLCHMFQ